MTSPSLRRLTKEAAELTASPSPHFHAHPISDSNLYDWHFTLLGPPPPSPYAGGIYHGRITFPPTYPLRPPSFRFLTPSGRFEVNREICLSISGHHEETWQPAWGIRTALIAIRSFMDGEVRGQVGGLEVGEGVRREYARLSRGWCCEGCGGRSNEEVMRGWWEFCRERGVEVDVDVDADVEGKTEGGKVEKSEEAATENESRGESRIGTADETVTLASTSTSTSTPSSAEKEKDASGGSMEDGAGPGSGSAQTPPVPATSSSDASRLPVQHQQRRPVSTATTAPSSTPTAAATSDSPWLDRAIFGVLVALIVMILRRVVDVDD